MFPAELFFTRIDVLRRAVKAAILADILLISSLRVHTVADIFHHLAKFDKLIADDLIVFVQSGLENLRPSPCSGRPLHPC